MSIIDGTGNKINQPKHENVKINTRSSNYPGVFGRPMRIWSDDNSIPVENKKSKEVFA